MKSSDFFPEQHQNAHAPHIIMRRFGTTVTVCKTITRILTWYLNAQSLAKKRIYLYENMGRNSYENGESIPGTCREEPKSVPQSMKMAPSSSFVYHRRKNHVSVKQFVQKQ